jgi:PBP1b-binding outer membrane lipoprotein LpoB
MKRNIPTIRLFRLQIVRILAIALPALLLVGCVQVSVLDRTTTPADQTTSVALSAREEHDVAILAVEFDPPLDALQTSSESGQVTLRVAVENKGYRKEGEVQVVVRLLLNQTGELLQKDAQTVSTLAPGEIRVLQFKGLVPSFDRASYRDSLRYRLEVTADPVSGEVRQADNYKSYEIRVAGK